MTRRAFLAPIAAIVLVCAVLVTQLAFGGDDFRPNRVPSACSQQPLGARTTDLDQVAQSVAILGLARAACTLGVSRDQLLLALPEQADRAALLRRAGHPETDLAPAIKEGLAHAVDRLAREGRLPSASALVQAYADQLGLPAFAIDALKGLPADLVDNVAPVDEILRDAVDQLDTQALIDGADDPEALQTQLRDVIVKTAIDTISERLRAQLPGPLQKLLGLS